MMRGFSIGIVLFAPNNNSILRDKARHFTSCIIIINGKKWAAPNRFNMLKEKAIRFERATIKYFFILVLTSSQSVNDY